MSTAVFISHARADRDLATALAGVLSAGFVDLVPAGVTTTNEFPSGFGSLAKISERIKQSQLVVQLISDRYLLSRSCMSQERTVRTLGVGTFPMIVPPLPMSAVPARVRVGRRIVSIDAHGALDELANTILASAQLGATRSSFWTTLVREFQEELPDLIPLAAPPTPDHHASRIDGGTKRGLLSLVPDGRQLDAARSRPRAESRDRRDP